MKKVYSKPIQFNLNHSDWYGTFSGENPYHNGEIPEKESNFFLTISTNRVPGTTDEVVSFAEVLSGMFDGLQGLFKFDGLIGKRGAAIPEGDSQAVRNWTGKYGIEIGTQKHRLHAHVLIKVHHNTRMQLDLEALKRYLVEHSHGRFSGFYVNLRLAPDSHMEERILSYIDKDENLRRNDDSED